MPDPHGDLADLIRTIPDVPVDGIEFRDITTLLLDGPGFRAAVDRMADAVDGTVDLVAGLEARGFLFAAPLAYALGVGLVPLRKPGKLPGATVSVAYELEYGSDELHLHVDAVHHGDRVVVVDDLVATGGTATAAVELLRGVDAVVDTALFLVDLPDLGGADRLRAMDVDVRSLVTFRGA